MPHKMKDIWSPISLRELVIPARQQRVHYAISTNNETSVPRGEIQEQSQRRKGHDENGPSKFFFSKACIIVR